MKNDTSVESILDTLQEPAPPYVVACLAAIATIGTTPYEGLMERLVWVLRCLGCPFVGIFYFFNIGWKNSQGKHKTKIAMSAYWLKCDNFYEKKNGTIVPLRYRPFGYHAMDLCPRNNQKLLLEECVSEATILDRFASVLSVYHIVMGIIAGIYLLFGCLANDWPHIPIALSWVLPAVYERIIGGRVVFKDPNVIPLEKKVEQSNLDAVKTEEYDKPSNESDIESVYEHNEGAVMVEVEKKPWKALK
ncbi:2648_t:CDS:2 [Acaulospora colombiana]|uniref:2648_t:CDS:1 n=1 Tax=Acaulospora colombiana TaxID=27376 RepID=A0ACA9LGU5_9GLOM|nr:2648_t:CDS:2 [Acaulospora colombiana]